MEIKNLEIDFVFSQGNDVIGVKADPDTGKKYYAYKGDIRESAFDDITISELYPDDL